MGDISFIKSIRGGKLLLYQNFLYRIHRKKDEISYWKCSSNSTCNARIKLDKDNVESSSGVHKHEPPRKKILRKEFSSKLKERAATEITVPVSRIYKEEMALIANTNEVASCLPNFKSAETFMYRKRSSVRPPMHKVKSPVRPPMDKVKSPVRPPMDKVKSPVRPPMDKVKSPVRPPMDKVKSPVRPPENQNLIMTRIDEIEELKTIEKDLREIDRAIEELSSKRDKLLSRKKVLIRRQQENAAEELANQDWERCDHPWSNKVTNTLKTMFKMDKFRAHQLATINAVMSRQDCILLMPTGGGKSLCYQLPAMVLDGITLVVSPLVSLMEDQVMAMEALNLPAAFLNANSSREHVNNVHKQMTEKNPSIKLLYVTPEKLAKSKRFMAKLEKMYKMGLFSLLAIDEVHCCSQWGHDFRTDYKFLGIMKRQFPNVPILGLTATATSSVIVDVQNILNIQSCLVLKASFNRPNLKYEVVYKSSCQKDNVAELENMLKNRFNGLSGIIYCFSVKDSDEIASELRKRGIKARAYHAQLDAQSRSSVHKQWASNALQVIVATVAFGMGIDKPDVRFVIHHSMPKSMENFYQESGRAGRDDQNASCILFFRFPDIFRQSTMVFTEQKGLEHLYAMVAYCLDLSRCRRAIIAQHFGERWNSSDCNSMCDHCDNFSPYIEKTKNITKEYRTLKNIIDHCERIGERLTSQKLIEAWIGKGPPKLRPADHKATLLSRENCERIIALLLLESYLMEEFHFTPYSTISYINIGSRSLPTDQELMFPMPVLRAKASSSELRDVSSSSKTTKTSSPSKQSSGSCIQAKPKTISSKESPGSSKASGQKSSKPSSKESTNESKELCFVNPKNSLVSNGAFVTSKRSSTPEKTVSSKKLKAVEEVTLSDEDKQETISKKTTPSFKDQKPENELEFDDYNLESHMKKPAYKRIATVTLSDSE